MSADSCADLLERLFSAYEDRHTPAVIEELATECRTQVAGQTPPGARLEMLERLLRQRLDDPHSRPAERSLTGMASPTRSGEGQLHRARFGGRDAPSLGPLRIGHPCGTGPVEVRSEPHLLPTVLASRSRKEQSFRTRGYGEGLSGPAVLGSPCCRELCTPGSRRLLWATCSVEARTRRWTTTRCEPRC